MKSKAVGLNTAAQTKTIKSSTLEPPHYSHMTSEGKLQIGTSKVNLLMKRIYSLVSWPVCAIRVSRGGLEPSAIARRCPRRIFRKTLNNNDLNQVVASSGFSESKGLGGWDAQSRGLIKPGLGHSYYRIFPPSLTGDVHPKSPRTTGNEAGEYT